MARPLCRGGVKGPAIKEIKKTFLGLKKVPMAIKLEGVRP